MLREWTRLVGHRGQVHGLAFTEGGLKLVSGGRDDAIHVWNPESGELLQRLESGSTGLGALACAKDGSLVAAHWRQLQQVWIYDLSSGAQVAQLPLAKVSSLDFSPAGDRLLVASPEGLSVWDLMSYQELSKVEGSAKGSRQARFDRAGAKILSAGAIPFCYDAETLEALGPLFTHSLHAFDMGHCLDLTENEDKVVVGWGHSERQDVGSVRVASWPEMVSIQVMRGHKPAVGSVALSPEGRHVVSVGLRDNLIKVWEIASGRMVEEHVLPGVTVARFSPTGVFLATGSAMTSELMLWEWAS